MIDTSQVLGSDHGNLGASNLPKARMLKDFYPEVFGTSSDFDYH